jgi:crotonobetainyl-CoA:carnitine CoA-transferase CaiB-like acyl-CoA transferase
MSDAPLTGVTILDLSRVLSGPYCTMLAADMGARVIKIEHPRGGDDTRAWGPPFLAGESAYYLSINRNKESVALDFKTPDGRALLGRLVEKADVIVENFRPGTLDKLGLGYSQLAERFPRLIYVSISGFGQNGPRRSEAGYDAIAQAEGGLMSITGVPEGPPVRLGVAVADIVSGMFAFQGLLLALLSRARTNRGQLVDVSLLDSVAALLTYQASRHFATGEVPARTGNRHMTIAPYDTYETSDGVLVLAVGNDAQWQRLCAALGLEILQRDARYQTNAGRVTHYDELRPALSDVLRSRRIGPLVESLRRDGVPCGGVRSIPEALADPQIAARDMVETVMHPLAGPIQVLGIPTKLSDSPGAVRTPPPLLGEHTATVLESELGLSRMEIDRLASAGAIGRSAAAD